MSNFTKRLIFGIIYVLLVIYATMFNRVFFVILFYIFMNFSIYEFQKMVKLKSVLPYLFGLLSFFSIVYIDDFQFNLELKIILSTVIILHFYPLLKVLFAKNENAITYLGKVYTSYLYLVIPFSSILLIPVFSNARNEVDTKIILGLFILIWTNDTFAYLVGRKIGKHKLFERISPKKTIEGFIGGLLFTYIAAIIIAKYFINSLPIIHWLSIASIIVLFGSLGDLIESMFKRQAKIKDSSNLIPGHGGFLDRLDSVIFASPFILIYLILIS